VHTFGSTFDPKGLPASFSIYDGRVIHNQNLPDERFSPAGRPLPMGCVAETLTFLAGLQTGKTYVVDDFYKAIPPGDDGGRNIRLGLKAAIDRGFEANDGTYGDKELAYFNCYGVGEIDDFEAARFGLWLNQQKKRAPGRVSDPQALRTRFDRIFLRHIGFATLDRLLTRLLRDNQGEILIQIVAQYRFSGTMANRTPVAGSRERRRRVFGIAAAYSRGGLPTPAGCARCHTTTPAACRRHQTQAVIVQAIIGIGRSLSDRGPGPDPAARFRLPLPRDRHGGKRNPDRVRTKAVRSSGDLR
jgi:hypothetical protein